MMKCFYHSADLDGKCSGAIVKLRYPDCELIGIDYGDPFPWDRIERNETVYVVDFAIQPHADMVRLADLCTLVWLDHHKTAVDWADSVGFNPPGVRCVGLAGCELTWNQLHAAPMPVAVFLLGRYDVWDHSDERTLPFQYGMRLASKPPEDTAWWFDLFSRETAVADIIDTGRICQQYQAQSHAGVCAFAAHEMVWEGMRWVAINGPYRSSQTFDSVYDTTKHDGMLVYCWNGKQWRFGLYSTQPNVDVSAIAKRYGGGGHKGAAGFQTAALPFVLGTAAAAARAGSEPERSEP